MTFVLRREDDPLRVAGREAERQWEWQAKVWRAADSLMTFNQYLIMALFAITLGVWIAGVEGQRQGKLGPRGVS